ncbi:MAG: YicC/YloC family endoribonuclease [Lachnospiraceae bacterium]
MTKSMTGFGRGEVFEQEYKITVEMKSVNHRYLDLNIKMPKKLNSFESAIRSILKEYIQRGKVDVFISCEDFREKKGIVTYHPDIARAYVEQIQQMAEEFQLRNTLDAVTLSHYPDVLTLEDPEIEEDVLWKILEKALRQAAEQFNASREKEGQHLKKDLLEKLEGMKGYVSFIEEHSGQVVQEYRERLEQKVKDLLCDTQFEESRIVTEVTLFADKICVDEETVRLTSHIESMKQTLEDGNGVGRKLDFIAQELNREANTVLSKVSDVAITDTAISLKTDIEKIREQVQNIE